MSLQKQKISEKSRMEAILSGRDLFGPDPTTIFRALKHLPPGLMLDVGAAAGYYTEMMHRYSPDSRIIAFEPFTGNHKFFQANMGAAKSVELRKLALGSKSGTSNFYVSEVVKGSTTAWKGYDGYSSVGFLA